MSFEEKVTWVSAVVSVIVAAAYFWIIGGQAGRIAVTEIAYQKPMLVAVGAMILLTVAGTIAMSIATAIRNQIISGGTVQDIDRKDERDVHINRRGELVGYYVSSVFMLGILAITMLGYPHFWIANGMFAAFVTAGLVGSIVKIVAYRRGF